MGRHHSTVASRQQEDQREGRPFCCTIRLPYCPLTQEKNWQSIKVHKQQNCIFSHRATTHTLEFPVLLRFHSWVRQTLTISNLLSEFVEPNVDLDSDCTSPHMNNSHCVFSNIKTHFRNTQINELLELDLIMANKLTVCLFQITAN